LLPVEKKGEERKIVGIWGLMSKFDTFLANFSDVG